MYIEGGGLGVLHVCWGGGACMCVCYVKDGKMELIGLELKQDWME